MTEQQEFARALVRSNDPVAADPPYLFLAWQANTAGQRHYRANTLNGLLTQLAAALQVTDATGALVDFQRTHRMRHTRATDCSTLACRSMSCSGIWAILTGMTMHYAETLAETHEPEFLRFAKLGRDARSCRWTPPTSTSWCSCTATPTGSCPAGSVCCPRSSVAIAATRA